MGSRHLDERKGRSILDVFHPRIENVCQARVALTAIPSKTIGELATMVAVAVRGRFEAATTLSLNSPLG